MKSGVIKRAGKTIATSLAIASLIFSTSSIKTQAQSHQSFNSKKPMIEHIFKKSDFNMQELDEKSFSKVIANSQVILIGDKHNRVEHMDFIINSTKSGFFSKLGFNVICIEKSYNAQNFVDTFNKTGIRSRELDSVLSNTRYSYKIIANSYLMQCAHEKDMTVLFATYGLMDFSKPDTINTFQYLKYSNDSITVFLTNYIKKNPNSKILFFIGQAHIAKVASMLTNAGISAKPIFMYTQNQISMQKDLVSSDYDKSSDEYKELLIEARRWDYIKHMIKKDIIKPMIASLNNIYFILLPSKFDNLNIYNLQKKELELYNSLNQQFSSEFYKPTLLRQREQSERKEKRALWNR